MDAKADGQLHAFLLFQAWIERRGDGLDKAQTRPSMHSGENPAELKEELEKVSAEYKALYEEFSGVSKAPESSSRQ